jgi:hypothetical protein
MAKRYGRPSAQYRYEHYDPVTGAQGDSQDTDPQGT